MRTVTTLIKFMTKEELVEMLTQIKNFKNPVTGKFHHGYNTYNDMRGDGFAMARHRFRIENLDYEKALINEDGGCVRYKGCSKPIIDMLKIKYGFEEES